MAMASVVMAQSPAILAAKGKPPEVQAKIDAIKAAVKSKVETKGKAQQVRTAQGDMVLIHDGKRVIDIKEIDPLEAMSIPSKYTVFAGPEKAVDAEIKKLGLAEKSKAKAIEAR